MSSERKRRNKRLDPLVKAARSRLFRRAALAHIASAAVVATGAVAVNELLITEVAVPVDPIPVIENLADRLDALEAVEPVEVSTHATELIDQTRTIVERITEQIDGTQTFYVENPADFGPLIADLNDLRSLLEALEQRVSELENETLIHRVLR